MFVPFRLRNQKWDTYHYSGTQRWLDSASRSRRIHAENRQTWLGQVALRPVSAAHRGCVRASALPQEHRARPAATVPARANRRKKRKATGSAGEPPAAAARSRTAASSQGHSDRQPAATAAQDGSPGQLLFGNYHEPYRTETPKKQNVPPAVVNLVSPLSAEGA